MRGVLQINEPNGPRFELALEQLRAGLGFTFSEVWFRKDGDILHCEAISPYTLEDLTDVGARELLEQAQSKFQVLQDSSPSFSAMASTLQKQYSVVVDYGTGTTVAFELRGDQLVRRA